jgi:hypothetical protein
MRLLRRVTGARVGGAAVFAGTLLAATTSVSSATTAASLGPPGQWTRVTETNGRNTDLVGLARTGDGVLHVAWQRHEPNFRGGIWHSAIGPDGNLVGNANAIVTDWGAVNDPDLVRTADGGLRVFFGGLRNAFVGDPNNSLNTASAPASGASWALQPGSVARTTSVYARTVGAAVANDGTPVVAWDGNRTEAGYHFGLDQGGPEVHHAASLSTETCGCPAYPDVAVDSQSGEIALGWNSLIGVLPGVYAQTITTSGAGAALRAPGSSEWDQQRTGIVARIGAPGIFVGYTGGSPRADVRLWRVGASAPVFTIPAQSARFATAAAAPEGRIWLLWMRENRIFATRTNEDATRHGPVVSVAPPPGTTNIWRLSGEGSRGPLDVLANVSTTGSLANWHTQVLPPLDLTVRSAPPAPAGKKAVVTVLVTDAGDPVPNVLVRLAGQQKRTNARGTAAFSVRQRGTLRATASRPGYREDQARVKVKTKKPRR